jgi:hypothetical protein
MGAIGNWIHVLVVGSIYGVFQAVKVPLSSANNTPSNLVWVECALAGLGIGMLFAFHTRALFQIPLVLIFVPVFAGDMLIAWYLKSSNPAPGS